MTHYHSSVSSVPELVPPWYKREGATGRVFSVKALGLWNLTKSLLPPPEFDDLMGRLQRTSI